MAAITTIFEDSRYTCAKSSLEYNIMSSRLAGSESTLPELKSVEEVTRKLHDHNLVLILFNRKFINEHDIELKFDSLRQVYERNHNLYVYKCVISPLSSPLKTEYKVTKAPTFVFFRQGKELHRLEDVGKVDSSSSSSAGDDEEKLRGWLDRCCNTN